MNPALFLARRWLGLPPRRFSGSTTTGWVAMSDGVRLATTVALPDAPARSRPSVLIRSHLPSHRRTHSSHVLARLLAGSGFCAVVQECRGRYASEGRFEPFVHEAGDGRDTVAWIAEQPWYGEGLGLLGAGYSGFCAWSTVAAATVDALAVGFAARDPHALFYPGGALALDLTLRWGLGLGERELLSEKELDLDRATRFRPVREADRVALREAPWFRDWIDHPSRDAWWDARVPALPASPPATLIVGSWDDPAVDTELADWRALEDAARTRGAPAPALVIGSWPETRLGSGALGAFLRHAFAFLDEQLAGGASATSRVRVFATGSNRWRDGDAWPLGAAAPLSFHLHSLGRANGEAGNGRLDTLAPAKGEAPDQFSYDPGNPVPTDPGRERRRTGAESRPDVLCYTSAPLDADLEVCGDVRALIFASSTAPDTDFSARLVDVAPDGATRRLCDGVLRCRAREQGSRDAWLEPGTPEALEIALGAVCHRLDAGHRLRLELSSSNFPRYDRHPNTKVEPARAEASDCELARQTVFHDDARPSRLLLTTL